MTKQKTKIMRTVHDADCPKCGFPETVIVREMSGKPILEECSKEECDWGRKLNN